MPEQLDSPGFLRTAEGGYKKVEYFLAFVAGSVSGRVD